MIGTAWGKKFWNVEGRSVPIPGKQMTCTPEGKM